MSCLELILIRLDKLAVIRLALCNNLLAPHELAYRVLFCFVRHAIIFSSGERANAGSVGCSAKFHKIIWKTVIWSTILVKLQTYNPKLSN